MLLYRGSSCISLQRQNTIQLPQLLKRASPKKKVTNTLLTEGITSTKVENPVKVTSQRSTTRKDKREMKGSTSTWWTPRRRLARTLQMTTRDTTDHIMTLLRGQLTMTDTELRQDTRKSASPRGRYHKDEFHKLAKHWSNHHEKGKFANFGQGGQQYHKQLSVKDKGKNKKGGSEGDHYAKKKQHGGGHHNSDHKGHHSEGGHSSHHSHDSQYKKPAK